MATNVSYPGVYIEEVPSGVRSIAGVATSVAAFVGYTARGPIDRPVRIFSFADFERQFGGLSLDSDLSYAVSQFFLNGGSTAWIVRVASGAAAATIDLQNQVDGGGDVVLTASASAAGNWGNNLRITVDYDTSNPGSLFNLNVAEVVDRNGRLQAVRSESHRNLSMNSLASNYALNIVNSASSLIRLARPGGLAFPANGTAVSGVLADANLAGLSNDVRRLSVALDGGRPREFDVMGENDPLVGAFPANLADLAARIQAAVRALDAGSAAFADFTCVAAASGRLMATSGTDAADVERSSVSFAAAGQRNAVGILRLGTANGGREAAAAAAIRPAQTGTAWVRRDPPDVLATLDTPGTASIDLMDGANVIVTQPVTIWNDVPSRPATLADLRARLQTAINGVARREFSGASVALVDERIVATPGGDNPGLRFAFTDGPDLALPFDLITGSEANIAAYQLGVGPSVAAQSGALPGSDGTPPGPIELQGSRADKSGMFALEDADLFNILMFPNQPDPALQSAAIVYAEERRAFVILDLPSAVDTPAEAEGWLTANGGLRHKNAAAYFPRAQFADPLQNNRTRSFANSGAIAGLYARTDATRGVWKAPAGTDAVVRGVRALDYVLTDGENGVLNPLGLNALRQFPAFGPIAWGARTLVGSDALASEWKYVPVRRLALFLEESLYRGTQWVVFEPNDEPLWAQIRLNVGAFMNNLFRQGAFQGSTPRDAYLVKCDSSTTTQDDINLGIVNIEVGFAPLKPAEFVIIKLQQLAGQAGAGA